MTGALRHRGRSWILPAGLFLAACAAGPSSLPPEVPPDDLPLASTAIGEPALMVTLRHEEAAAVACPVQAGGGSCLESGHWALGFESKDGASWAPVRYPKDAAAANEILRWLVAHAGYEGPFPEVVESFSDLLVRASAPTPMGLIMPLLEWFARAGIRRISYAVRPSQGRESVARFPVWLGKDPDPGPDLEIPVRIARDQETGGIVRTIAGRAIAAGDDGRFPWGNGGEFLSALRAQMSVALSQGEEPILTITSDADVPLQAIVSFFDMLREEGLGSAFLTG